MIKFAISLQIEKFKFFGCQALDLARNLKLRDTTSIISIGYDHRLKFDVEEAFARKWFYTEILKSAKVGIHDLKPGDVELDTEYQIITLSQNLTIARAKELFIQVQQNS